MDEIKLFTQLQPPPPPDAPRMREAARARLTAATSAELAHLPRRRRTVVVAMAAAALVAAGTGYGLAAVQGGPASPRARAAAGRGSSHPPTAAAGLTAVPGCPGKYITAGTLEQVSGTRLILQPANDHDHVHRAWRAQRVTVATSASTVITRPASGTVSDITDGLQVIVQGDWSGGKLAATQVGIEAALPSPQSFGPPVHGQRLRKLMPTGFTPARATGTPSSGGPGTSHPSSKPALGPPVMSGTVVDAHDGSFTLVVNSPLLGVQRFQVITSNSTKVISKASASLSRLRPGANVVAVGTIGPQGVLTASTVAEPSLTAIILAGGPAKIGPSGCSATAITTAAILAGG